MYSYVKAGVTYLTVEVELCGFRSNGFRRPSDTSEKNLLNLLRTLPMPSSRSAARTWCSAGAEAWPFVFLRVGWSCPTPVGG